MMLQQSQLPFDRPLPPAWPAPAPTSLHQSTGKVTEIVVQDGDDDDFLMLLPLLARLSREQRWFTWIAPLQQREIRRLQEAGVDTSKIILLKPSHTYSTFELACRALKTGTCHAVIRLPGALPKKAFEQLQRAAREGGSQAILIRSR